MLISKNHLKARHAVSKDAARPILTTIQVTRDEEEVVAVATDGYALCEVRETTPDDRDFPNVSSKFDGTYRIHGPTAKKVAASLPKTSKSLPILTFAHVGAEGVTVTNLEQTLDFTDRVIEGNFPDYDKLIPDKTDAKAVLKVDPVRLRKLLDAFTDEHTVTIEIHGDLSPFVIRAEDFEATITGVLMPLKS